MEYEENDCVSALFQTLELVERKWTGLQNNTKIFSRCRNLEEVVPESFERRDLTKNNLANYLSGYVHQLLIHQSVFDQCRTVVDNLTAEKLKLKEEINQLKSSTISAQDSIISLQNELLSNKNEQLNSLQTSVSEAVKSSVKTEIRSYSEAVQSAGATTDNSSKPVMKSIKRAVEEVVQAEDRSKNVIVFGMKEDAKEITDEKVDELLEHLGSKPRHESVRIGVQKNVAENPRPIKVSLASSAHVLQLLRAARILRHSESFKDVFVCPDRTIDERKARKEVVSELKKKLVDDPTKRHYIRGGKVVTVSSD